MPKARPFKASHFAVLPEISSMGAMILDPIWGLKAHSGPYCELIYVMKGTVDLVIGRQHYHGKPGQILLVRAGQRHRDNFDFAQGLQVFYVLFSWARAKDYFSVVSNRVVEQMPAPRKAEISRLMERLTAGGQGETEADRLVAGARVLTVLLLVLCEATQGRLREFASKNAGAAGSGRALMLQAKQFLQEHYAERISLEDIARALGISAFHLSHVFSQESDSTLFSYLTQLRMEKARELLHGGMKVASVARAVGYGDSSYFSKSFHRYFSVLPGRVRRDRIKLP